MQSRRPVPEQATRLAALRAFCDNALDDYPELSQYDEFEPDFWDGIDCLRIADDWVRQHPQEGPKALADGFVFPTVWDDLEDRRDQQRYGLQYRLCDAWITAHPDAYALEQICARLRHMLQFAFEDSDYPLPTDEDGPAYYRRRPDQAWALPDVPACINRLSHYPSTPAWQAFAEWLLDGSWNREQPPSTPGGEQRTLADAYIYGHEEIRRIALGLMEAGRLDYPRFVRAANTWGRAMMFYSDDAGLDSDDVDLDRYADEDFDEDDSNDDDPQDIDDESSQPDDAPAEVPSELANFTARYVEDALAGLPDNAVRLADTFRSVEVYQTRWLLQALAAIERLGMAPDDFDSFGDTAAVLQCFLLLQDLPKDQSAALLAALSGFSRNTLLTALPYAGQASPVVLDALGWRDLQAFQREYLNIALAPRSGWGTDLPNTLDETVGVVDRYLLDKALAEADPDHLREYLAALEPSHWAFPETRVLLDAYQGIGRAALEKKLTRHAQAAMRIYGVLPVKDADDVRQRYLTLKKLHKEVRKYGAERQANSHAAVQAGLENLARVAGYPSAIRLEWAMESEIAESALTAATVDGYDITLVIDGLSPTLTICKAGKTLKTAPPAVRKNADFIALKTQQTQLKEQITRFCRTLEAIMSSGETLALDDLKPLLKMPAVRLLLEQLIVQADDAALGWLDAATLTVTDLEGRQHVAEKTLRIAHPFHLFTAGQLSAWQKEVVTHRRVQPFKQAFRELYLLTPAERDTGLWSNRFAGHRLKAKVAARLLQVRNWSTSSVEDIYYESKEHGIYALFNFLDTGHYLSETEHFTFDTIAFHRNHKAIPLEQVPPLLFSEVMRDADLLVSVAHAADDYSTSQETLQRRAELVGELIQGLGLQNVKCEGHFLHVTGQRANYRIHLGSAAIHIEPGNYLCIVPAGSSVTDFYLPFADTDRKMAEVLSKMFLLLDDMNITDSLILEQIQRGG
ncbi:protein of unknown function [Pseudomonas sp. NFACC23-1]|uniref:DUF4132 domain-containing protein n=1 Tax=unclassified Pseudomonas TaxID=196821 RepID=UPI000887C791|nr:MULTISPECIES: DUF4132 domain-containing protein [unclassified Pseudomonas]SDB11011.1 protein of unknown function [Pseudomonas sp. NFACC17-2]SEI90339.1 protein of unknown function [Pseudomonas sp. NFACC23-1]SFW17383.1 protein of unknown function [Pseudomonas sp. NFACC16-2]